MIKASQFSTYLTKRGFHPQTIYGYTNKLKQYFVWCDQNHLDSDRTTLDELYDYKRYCLEQGLKNGSIRERLSVIKHYFQSIHRKDNPALLVKHKKRVMTLPDKVLTEEDLKELYRNIEVKTFIQRRDKAMLGLVIFQALKRDELELLEIHHLDLDEATIYVPSSTKTNSRTLDLHPTQMNHLMTYLYDFRPKLLAESAKETNRLFFSMGSSNSLNNALQIKVNAMKKQFPNFKSLMQVKESRMTLWIKQHGIRKAQYFSGIKYASSMLRYKTTSIEKLKKKLSIAHPMERLKL